MNDIDSTLVRHVRERDGDIAEPVLDEIQPSLFLHEPRPTAVEMAGAMETLGRLLSHKDLNLMQMQRHHYAQMALAASKWIKTKHGQECAQ